MLALAPGIMAIYFCIGPVAVGRKNYSLVGAAIIDWTGRHVDLDRSVTAG